MLPQTHKNMLGRIKKIIDTAQPELAESFMRIPLEYYRSKEVAQKEREAFLRVPITLCHSSQVAKPFDYTVRNVMGKSLLVTRNAEGEPRVFLNTCRHRGAEVAQGCGSRRRFTCPYHAWSYDSDGKLVSMPLRDRYEGLDIDELGLTQLPCEERHGFIWAVLTPGLSIDVAAHLGAELDAELAARKYDECQFIGEPREADLECNWKGLAEGFLESFHVPYIHRETFKKYNNPEAPDLAGYDKFGPHVRWFSLNPPNLRPEIDLDAEEVNVADYASVVYWIYPNLTLANTSVLQGCGTIYINYFPGEEPMTCQIRGGYFSPKSSLQNPEQEQFQKEMAAEAIRAVLEEDAPALASCGRGLSTGAEYVFVGRNEQGVQLMAESCAEMNGVKLEYLQAVKEESAAS